VARALKRAVFLDRDGTINKEVGYLDDPERFELLPGAGRAIARLNRAGLPVVVVSNQSGVARGYFSIDILTAIDWKMADLLARDGASLEGVYYCPHHPEAELLEYRQECTCRKPKPGLIQMASDDLDLSPADSFVIGDKLADVQAGQALGARSILLLSGYGRAELRKLEASRDKRPDHVARDLVAATDWVLDKIG
jgi:D-glycero-D-manno-heptose 1,7-bisphosphate phosphatase